MAPLLPNALHFTLTKDGLSIGPIANKPEQGIDLSKLTGNISIKIEHDSFVQALIELPVHSLDLEKILPLCHITYPVNRERERPKLMGIPLELWPREHALALLKEERGPEWNAAFAWYDENSHLVEP